MRPEPEDREMEAQRNRDARDQGNRQGPARRHWVDLAVGGKGADEIAGFHVPSPLNFAASAAKPRCRATRTAPFLLLAIVPALLAAANLAELLAVPAAEWGQRLAGTNAISCLKSIPFLSAAPLVAVLLALRQGAPEHPALAGAAAGLFAGAIGAACYATHCPDDSPLFVAAWYTLAIGFVAAIGAVAGRRLLRW
jgi:hypothetical protein